MTGSLGERSLPSHETPGFQYYKPLMRVSAFELSLSLQKHPKDLKHRLGPRTGTNPDCELLKCPVHRVELSISSGCERRLERQSVRECDCSRTACTIVPALNPFALRRMDFEFSPPHDHFQTTL
jgi:hypothetical protein